MFSLRSKITIYISILVAVVVLASLKFNRNSEKAVDKNSLLLRVVMQGLNTAHFQPEKIDDNFSKKVFDLYLKRLDVNKKFLTQADITQLMKFQTDIDDQVKRGSHDFFEQTTLLFNTRVKETEGYYKEILAKPFDFEKEESIETDPDKMSRPTDKAALREAWRKYLKYQTLGQLTEMMDMQEKAKERGDNKDANKSFAEMEAEARKKVLKTYEDFYKRLSQNSKEEQFSLFMNAITNTYDPHTEYFAPDDKASFDIEMTGRLEGIGASLQERDGFIKVAEIVPGSASYRQGELKAGDIIIKVAQANQEPVSVEGMRLDNAIKLIRGKKGTEVRLTVKKPDGTIKVIPIIREVVIIEETYAQSAVINSDKKIGYIRLPKFYADFSRRGGRNSGEDVRKEVEKLKQEGASGIILDLRTNGGGSLSDAVEMSGLFIPKGPIVQVETSGSAPQVLEDKDPTVQFDGPLVVMVNSFSASASEIVAAAMQDYKRAIIIGSPTYGKGTVQQVFDLDQAIQGGEYSSMKPFGSLKLTTQKFYRINGGATQLRGVTPDIILPDFYSFLKEGEKDQDYPLPWDEIKPANYKPWNPSFNIASVKAKSQQRVSTHPSFVQVTQQAERMRKRMEQSSQSLKLTTFRAEQKKSRDESKKYETLEKSMAGLTVSPLRVDLAQAKDTLAAGRYNKFAKNIQKDIYVNEAVNIVKDQF
ncbi:carboxy terminal-processing peptidase [Adhaeribacter aquaticus]|uniref:carboxy terminal-processing peptidase n=1 Tax=Adhaeribacter aquaticus TaxID=299567 RepID=UPI000413171C|nr:carboxy terminal-processing peptidase [Adhaeribacter aquaticus]